VTLTNNSICYNTANGNGPSPSGNGGGVLIRLSDDHDTANIYNNIVWNNSAVNNGSDFHIDNDGNENLFRSQVNLYSNDFDQSAAGFYIKLFIPIDPSNLNNANPLFADSANDDYHITAGSPCKDAGDNSAPSLPERDMDDEPRIIEGVVDMGADEFVDLCEGDFDTDSDVDGSDLAVFAADFGRTDCASGLPCEGDFDTDNDVDGSDLAVFAADFGRTDCPTSD
jgi:hypothetical protein